MWERGGTGGGGRGTWGGGGRRGRGRRGRIRGAPLPCFPRTHRSLVGSRHKTNWPPSRCARSRNCGRTPRCRSRRRTPVRSSSPLHFAVNRLSTASHMTESTWRRFLRAGPPVAAPPVPLQGGAPPVAAPPVPSQGGAPRNARQTRESASIRKSLAFNGTRYELERFRESSSRNAGTRIHLKAAFGTCIKPAEVPPKRDHCGGGTLAILPTCEGRRVRGRSSHHNTLTVGPAHQPGVFGPPYGSPPKGRER